MTKVIVVGAGNWGQNLIRNYHNLGALEAVAEANPVLREKIQREYPTITALNDFEEALSHGSFPLVIATPAPTHFELGLKALQAGKDVYIEKPLTLSTAQAEQLTAYAEANNQILMVGHLLLYQPAISWISNFLKTPEAGTVRHVSSTRAKLGTARNQENVWWSFAPHDVSVVLEFLGHPTLTTVQASGLTYTTPGVEDTVHAHLTFEGGKSAHLHSSWLWPHNDRRTVIITDKLMITYNEVKQQVTIHRTGISESLETINNGSEQITGIANTQPLEAECKHFLHCVATRETPRTDGRNGIAVVNVLERVQEALNEQK